MSEGKQQVTPSIKIEIADVHHADLLAALHKECFKDPWDAEAFASLLMTPGTMGFFALNKQSSQPVGFILLRCVVGEAEILSIGVLPGARSMGVGGKLLTWACQLDEIATLFLDVAADNDSALRLYTREGFEEIGRRKAYYARSAGPRVDALTMKRELG